MMMTMSELATELHVDRRQVYAWYQRRARNGFPLPAKFVSYGLRRRAVWNLDEVVEWRRTYQPSRGGRPSAEVS